MELLARIVFAFKGSGLLLVLLSCVLRAASEPAFDEDFAREVVLLTEAAYCTEELSSWNCTVCQKFPGMTNISILQGQSRNIRGYVGVDTRRNKAETSTSRNGGVRALESDNGAEARLPSSRKARPRIVITFSGTDPKSIKNWIDDLEAAPIAHAYSGCDDCKVCLGREGRRASLEVQTK